MARRIPAVKVPAPTSLLTEEHKNWCKSVMLDGTLDFNAKQLNWFLATDVPVGGRTELSRSRCARYAR